MEWRRNIFSRWRFPASFDEQKMVIMLGLQYMTVEWLDLVAVGQCEVQTDY